ncbi:DUF6434 domain-containing protein [Pseudomonas aeruginosa]|uniref:DUF6434 domain-containing protein n=1 Tax=Pseudomonas aeruginosa TaxID=287 RepID=UPI000F546B00|nr:DUF6434 domain-containing protein [Pseudomonas aeruginosa]RQB76093.1 hypothetical protein IPC436_07770 [Pseudomonas aeruginosa]
MAFDWHGGTITRDTAVCRNYRNTQDVRRFLVEQCGADFRFDRAFMAWIGDGAAKTMGEVADEWRRRHADASPSA